SAEHLRRSGPALTQEAGLNQGTPPPSPRARAYPENPHAWATQVWRKRAERAAGTSTRRPGARMRAVDEQAPSCRAAELGAPTARALSHPRRDPFRRHALRRPPTARRGWLRSAETCAGRLLSGVPEV